MPIKSSPQMSQFIFYFLIFISLYLFLQRLSDSNSTVYSYWIKEFNNYDLQALYDKFFASSFNNLKKLMNERLNLCFFIYM